MDIFQRTVADILAWEEKNNRWEEQRLDVRRMIDSFGWRTLGKMHALLASTRVLCCGKKHEETRTGYEHCEHFETNLVCGHLVHTQNILGTPLRNAAGVIATSAYLVDAFGERISDRIIPRLVDIAERAHKLDGAAFAAYDGLRPHGPGYFNNIPSDYRQAALELIKDVERLRVEIMKQEADLGPPMLALRRDVLQGFEGAIGVPGPEYSAKA